MDITAEATFLPLDPSIKVWSAKSIAPASKALISLYSDLNTANPPTAQRAANVDPLLLAVTSIEQNAVLALNDNTVQWFPKTSTQANAMKPLLNADPMFRAQALVIGSLAADNSQALFVASNSCQVHRYDAKTLVPLMDTIPRLVPPGVESCHLDSFAAGDLNGKGQDELVVASGSMLYIWSVDNGQWELVTTLQGLPKSLGLDMQPTVRSIAIGNVDGDRDGLNDIVVATDKSLYVFLHDPPPTP